MNDAGGQGAVLTRSDMRLISSALRRGWDIPDSLFRYVPRVIGRILKNGTDRDKIAAARVLVAMQESNIKHDLASSSQTHLHYHEHRGEVTVGNLDEYKRRLAAEIAGQGGDDG